MGRRDKQILVGIAALALVLMGLFFWMEQTSTGSYALVTVDGQAVMELNLAQTDDQQIDLQEYGVNVVLEVKDHQIHFLSSDCPDHLCINFGLIDHEPQSAVCMPNRVAVTINSQSTYQPS